MNKWVSISIIVVLVAGLAASLFLYFQESSNLRAAEDEIDALEGNVATLEGTVSTLEADLATSEAEVDRLEGELAAAQAEVTRLEGELTTAQDEISTLQADLAEAQAEVDRLEGELAAAEAEVDRLGGELAAAQAEVASLEGELATAQDEISTLSDELVMVKDPRHFNSLVELNNWLAQDDTNTEYAGEEIYNYGYILQVKALRDGYLLPAFFEDWDGDYIANISGNLAYIGDEIYIVLPFMDAAILWFFAVDIPSHPLPLE